MISEWTVVKLLTSFAAALLMYFASFPAPIIALLIMQGADLVIGSIEAIIAGQFRAKVLYSGILKRIAAWFLLVACHYAETPLRLAFDLDNYAACALTVYEFISVLETSVKLGILPEPLIKVLDYARRVLQIESTTVVKSRSTGTVTTETADELKVVETTSTSRETTTKKGTGSSI